MNSTNKTKPQADNKGLLDILGRSGQASNDIIANDDFLSTMMQMGQGDKLYQNDEGFIPIEGDRVGEIIDTAGKVIIPLVDNNFKPASFYIVTPNSNTKPELTEPNKPYALLIGEPLTADEIYAVKDIDTGIDLYQELVLTHGLNIAIIVSPNSWHFNNMVRYFAETRKIMVTATLDDKEKLIQPLKGANVKAIITELVPLHDIINYPSETLESVLATAKIIDLEALDWLEPESLSIDPSQPTPYPIDAWEGLLKSVVEKIAYYAQVTNPMAGQCVLGALSHMGQRFIDAPMDYSHMPASLYLVTEGESGSGKSVAMGLSHYEIKAYEREQYEIYLKRLDEWEAEKASLKGSELKDFLANTPKPHNPITMFDDATIEPILDKFIDGEMDNASWSTDEAGQFFNGHTMKGDTAGNALSALTKLYSDGVASRIRSQKNQHANPRSQAYDVRMTLLLMGQRIILEKALSDPMMNGQGFLARAMIACPEDLRGQRVWNDPKRRNQSPYKDPDLIAYWEKCRTLLDPAPINDPSINSKGRIKIRWHDTKAHNAFLDGKQAIENRQAKGQALEYLKAYASRMAENASRIASLMAFFEGRNTITANDIHRAFMLVEYSTSERLRYLDASPTNEQSNSEKLSQWLVSKAESKNPHKLNYSYVYNGAPVPMRKNTKVLKNELSILESAGHIKLVYEGTRQVILINPYLYS